MALDSLTKMKKTLTHTISENQTPIIWTLVGLAAVALATIINLLLRHHFATRHEDMVEGYTTYASNGDAKEDDPGLMEEMVEHNWQGF